MTPEELRQANTLTVQQLREVFGFGGLSAVYRALSDGHIPGAYKMGGKWIIPAEPIRQKLGMVSYEEMAMRVKARFRETVGRDPDRAEMQAFVEELRSWDNG